MPGIVGIIRRDAHERTRRDLNLMVESMRHERYYVGNQYVNPHAGLYVGWMCHQGSFADCMPLISCNKSTVLIFMGEHYHHPGTSFSDANARHLLRLYDELGDDFIRGLNGWFCGLTADLNLGKIAIF